MKRDEIIIRPNELLEYANHLFNEAKLSLPDKIKCYNDKDEIFKDVKMYFSNIVLPCIMYTDTHDWVHSLSMQRALQMIGIIAARELGDTEFTIYDSAIEMFKKKNKEYGTNVNILETVSVISELTDEYYSSVISMLMLKHVASLLLWLKDESKLTKEQVREKLTDILVYLVMLYVTHAKEKDRE